MPHKSFLVRSATAFWTARGRPLLSVAVVSALAVTFFAPSPVHADPRPEPIGIASAPPGAGVPGRYIVTLKQGASSAAKGRRFNAKRHFSSVLNGFVAKLDTAQLRSLQHDRDVLAIEQDQVVHAIEQDQDVHATTTQAGPPWGLDRIDQRSLPLSKSYRYGATGAGSNVYVIDTGIRTSHSQFGGRASVALDVVGDGWDGEDCDGHGTHVAGTIGSRTFGVAKSANLISIRVLDCSGSGYVSSVVSALNWLRDNHASRAVANMSLGGGKSTALNTAVNNLSVRGVHMVVAAGNEGSNACNTSPASAAYADAVGATNSSDYRTSWSNYGSCVDVHAPGDRIASTYNGSDTAAAIMSGTSMAAPHVAGVVALYKQRYPTASYSTVHKWIIDISTKNKLKGMKTGTPNRLLYKGSF